MKYADCGKVNSSGGVAPHWGAWIEIQTGQKCVNVYLVAPHWGAWIEIVGFDTPRNASGCRTPLGCVD